MRYTTRIPPSSKCTKPHSAQFHNYSCWILPRSNLEACPPPHEESEKCWNLQISITLLKCHLRHNSRELMSCTTTLIYFIPRITYNRALRRHKRVKNVEDLQIKVEELPFRHKVIRRHAEAVTQRSICDPDITVTQSKHTKASVIGSLTSYRATHLNLSLATLHSSSKGVRKCAYTSPLPRHPREWN